MPTPCACLPGLLALAAVTAAGASVSVPVPADIQPPFVSDTLTFDLAEHFDRPDTGKSPMDFFEAAGVSLVAVFPTFAPGDMIGSVRLNPGSSLGRSFQIMQTFDFGADTRWSLRFLHLDYLYCGIPEGCPVREVRRLFNFSARAHVHTGEGATIGGLIVPGEFARLTVIKVRGPSLRNFGVNDPLANPRVVMHAGAEAVLANDDWTELRDWEQALAHAVCAPPDDPLEAMIVTYLDPGTYTAIVSGAAEQQGITLLEMYLVDEFRIVPQGPSSTQ